MSCLCPGKEAEVVSDDFIAVSDVTETTVCDTWCSRSDGSLLLCVTDADSGEGASGTLVLTPRVGLLC